MMRWRSGRSLASSRSKLAKASPTTLVTDRPTWTRRNLLGVSSRSCASHPSRGGQTSTLSVRIVATANDATHNKSRYDLPTMRIRLTHARQCIHPNLAVLFKLQDSRRRLFGRAWHVTNIYGVSAKKSKAVNCMIRHVNYSARNRTCE
jgi:hypothetical protein